MTFSELAARNGMANRLSIEYWEDRLEEVENDLRVSSESTAPSAAADQVALRSYVAWLIRRLARAKFMSQ